MDDSITSIASKDGAIKLAQEAHQLCASSSLRLHKFVSNDRAVLESVPPSECATDSEALDLAFDDLPERALGIHWPIVSDSFRFYVNLKQPASNVLWYTDCSCLP